MYHAKTGGKDIMVPLERYATIHEDRLLIDAIDALEKAQKEFEESPYVHRAVLAYDDNKKVVGKLSQWDVIKCLEPKYESFGNIRSTSLSGLSPELIKSMMKKYSLWQADLDDICNRVARKKVKDVMYRPVEGEKIDADATMGEALHSFIIGHHQSLLVTKESEIVGILRLVDVFKLLCEKVKKCRKNECGETKSMIKEMVWNKYLQEEGLDKYPEIVKLFDSDSEAIKLVKQALLNDRVLRPVFMQVLPEEKTGKMEICNKKLAAEKIKGDKTLADYIMENKGIFLCGKPKVANEILTRGGKIIVAMTDNKLESKNFSVANLRQCYIPLPDRRLLAFKSSGLFHDPVSKPYNKNSIKFTGVGGKIEKNNALTSFEKLGPYSEGFIDFLAYQPLYSLPDGKGNFEEAEYGNDGKKALPYLIVNCAISPHRISKILQLDDPGLFRLRKRISPLLKDLAIKRQRSERKLMPVLERFFNSREEVIPLEDYLLFIAEEIGIGTARKQNHELFHVTFHEQDVNMGGQMCDREEMYTFEDYFKKNEIKYVDPFFEIIKETHIGIRDMISAVGVIKFLYKSKREWKGNRLELLESFFRAYFRRLSYIYFERWESLIDYLGNVITFYFDRDDVLGQDGLNKLREWYRLEKEKRRKSKGNYR